MCAGSVSGMLAALTAAVAFTAIKFVPRGEPTVVLAMWFHCSALAMSIIPLAVRTTLRKYNQADPVCLKH